jgi:hypothetical protein
MHRTPITTAIPAVRRVSATVLALVGGLLAVGVVVVFLSLSSGGSPTPATASQATPSHATFTSLPRGAHCTYVRADHSCVWTP